MIWEIIKKQYITFVRNPQQLFLLLALPIILIIILSISLSGFISGDAIEIEAKVAFIEEENEQKQIDTFIQDIEKSDLHPLEKTIMKEQAKELQLIKILKDDVFHEINNIIQLEEIQAEKKAEILKNDEYAAIIEIPANFTYDFLRYSFLNEGKTPTIKLYENEGREIGVAAVKSVIDNFQEQVTIAHVAATNNINPNDLYANLDFGEITVVEQSRAVTSKEYYTIAMAVMNVLYIAVAISSFAFLEKESQVFDRIILSNVSRWTYFVGVFLSGTIFACVQLLLIFGFSRIVFGVAWELLPFFVVTISVSMAVGGLAVLLTAISYRFHSEAVTNFFSTIIIAFLALLGGSFFPIGDLSTTVQTIGDLTPNGAGLSAYLSILRGNDLQTIWNHLVFLLSFAIILIVIAVISFPKRGQTK